MPAQSPVFRVLRENPGAIESGLAFYRRTHFTSRNAVVGRQWWLILTRGEHMAIGWLTVLKMVPWGDVIENAPKVAQGAKKLWSSVGKKAPMDAASGDAQAPVADAGAPLAQLQAQVAELQVATAALHQQMLDSSALIKSLAEQNTVLVQRVEANRKRLISLAGVVVVLLIVLGFKLF